MRKLTFSFKSLLLAAGLLVGSANAWADTYDVTWVFTNSTYWFEKNVDLTDNTKQYDNTGTEVASGGVTFNFSGTDGVLRSCFKVGNTVKLWIGDAGNATTNNISMTVPAGYEISLATEGITSGRKLEYTVNGGTTMESSSNDFTYRNETENAVTFTFWFANPYKGESTVKQQNKLNSIRLRDVSTVSTHGYTVTAKCGDDEIGTWSEEGIEEGATYYVPAKAYIYTNAKYYILDDTKYTAPNFGYQQTMGTSDATFEISYSEYTAGDIVCFAEAETLNAASSSSSNNASGGKRSHANGSGKLSIGNLAAGVYVFDLGTNNNRAVYFRDGSNDDNTSNTLTYVNAGTATGTFYLSGETPIVITGYTNDSNGLNQSGDFDYVLIRKNTEAADAIVDCKVYETSDAFATYIDGKYASGELLTAAEVYAAHTAWQIENGVVTDGVRDITKVIRNAAVADATDWAGASTYTMPTKYPSAPDAVVLDAYNINSWATQTIYSLPAGVYTVTANTRGAADGYSHVYIYKSGVGDLATVATNTLGDGESAGTLGYGFSTVSATFTLTETSDLIFGFYAGLKETGKWASCDDWHLYKVESVSATVGANGYTTFASPYALDLTDANRPEGLKAYKATLTGSTLSFTKLNQTVPAGTGLLLLGETNGGTYNIPVVAGGDDVTNALVGVTSDTPLQSTVGGTYYFVMKKATTAEDDLAFAPISTTTAVTVPAGKTYVELDTSTGARSLTVAFDDEATGIKSVNGDGIMVNGFYNLNGQRVESPAKGLYIVNGKKVIMK
mgnify:CR=1 FL=1